jgi:hypothetical protein
MKEEEEEKIEKIKQKVLNDETQCHNLATLREKQGRASCVVSRTSQHTVFHSCQMA